MVLSMAARASTRLQGVGLVSERYSTYPLGILLKRNYGRGMVKPFFIFSFDRLRGMGLGYVGVFLDCRILLCRGASAWGC